MVDDGLAAVEIKVLVEAGGPQNNTPHEQINDEKAGGGGKEGRPLVGGVSCCTCAVCPGLPRESSF